MTGLLAVLLAGFAAAPPEREAADEVRIELRALEGYLGLYERSLALAQSAPSTAQMGEDLRVRLDRFLDRSDLISESRTEGLRVYRDLARIAARPPGPSASPAAGLPARELYGELLRRATAAGVESASLELEMLASPAVALDGDEAFRRLSGLLARLPGKGTEPPPADASRLDSVLLRLVAERSWPPLSDGEALVAVLELIRERSRRGGAPLRAQEVSKLIEWRDRMLAEESGREDTLARSTALVFLIRGLAGAWPELEGAERALVLKGLSPLVPPVLAELPPGAEGPPGTVEVLEVRLPGQGGAAVGPSVPGLPRDQKDGGSAYYLVPGKYYRVRLAASPADGGGRSEYDVLARAGADAGLVLPRSVPQGMVPITSPETGRIVFLADRRPWSMRRFLLALQRSWTRLAPGPETPRRIYERSSLRELPLPPGTQPDLAALTGFLSDASLKERLEEAFWIDAGQDAGREALQEIATSILTANAGLRDTQFSLPTVAEAQRLFRDGLHFGLEPAQGAPGLFNATRLVPPPEELASSPRYAIRTVLRLSAP